MVSVEAAKELRTVALERIKYELKNFDDYKLYLQTTGKIDASLSSELLENLKSIWSKADDEAASAVAKYGGEVTEVFKIECQFTRQTPPIIGEISIRDTL